MTSCPDCGRRCRLYLVTGNQEALCLDCLEVMAIVAANPVPTCRERESTGEARSTLLAADSRFRGRHGFGEHVPVGRGPLHL